MIDLQFPEFLLLAIPIGCAAHRWGGLRIDWRWAILAALWIGLALVVRLPWWLHLGLMVPIGFSLRPFLRESGVTGAIRLTIVSLLLLALAGPEWSFGGQGVDVVLVVDRSRSLPDDAHGNIVELVKNVGENRRVGDRVGLVTFGSTAAVEHSLSGDDVLTSFEQNVSRDGSDLNAGIQKALDLVDPDRPARILVLSDGESNGASPLSAGRRAREAGVPVDYRVFERMRVGDAAVGRISLPEEVAPREPFQFAVEVVSGRETSGTLTVRRDGRVISDRGVDLFNGANRFLFRDIVEQPGIRSYSVELRVPGDPLEENNVGAGLVRVDAGARILVLTSDGEEGNLVRELRSARLAVDVAAASAHPITQDSLDPYRAIIIENVPASEFGRIKMQRLAQFVEDLGGGLMLTGGRRSFGSGGYFNSPLDETLPVSMELREEHRKTRVAIAIALDRSGSMTAPVHGNKTKMDLANLGTAECVRLLSPGDSVAVIAVDSSPHVVQSLTDIDDTERIARKVLKIESLGGGIFVYDALVAAGDELMQATQATKHIILFSDAADSEEPGTYKNLLRQYEAAGITVSVIGLGTKADPDAQLLEDIAKRGSGNIMFTEDAEELPRLFTEDTMSVARSSFIEKDPASQPDGIPGALLAESRLLGNLTGEQTDAAQAFPTVDGYNLSYLRPEATAAVLSQDEYFAPWSAFWQRGLGRASALTVEVDGQFSGSFGRWEHYDDFLITHARWLLGGDDNGDVFLDIERQGQDAVVTVELDPSRPNRGSGGSPLLIVVPPGDERNERLEPNFTWTGPDTLTARFRTDRPGTYRTLVVSGEDPDGSPAMTRGPAVTLPYSPEFDLRDGLPSGREVLAEIAELTGGAARVDVVEVLRNPPRSARSTSLLPWLFTIVIVLTVLEILGRRLSLWEQLADATAATVPEAVRVKGWRPRMPKLPQRRTTVAASKPETSETPQPPVAPASDGGSNKASEEKPAVDVFAAAKQRAKRRM